MTKGLIKCGVMSEIRDIIQKMWIVYLKDTEVAFMNREQKFCEDELEEPEDLQESRNDVRSNGSEDSADSLNSQI